MFGQTHIPSFYGWGLTPCSDARWFDPVICGLSDSLALFLGSTVNQRAIIEARSDYLMNASERNRSLLGQAIINRAIELKETADANHDTSSVALYGKALVLFEKGSNYQNAMFGWQSEAWAFAILNRANTLFNALDNNAHYFDSLEVIIVEYKKAIAILENVQNSFTSVSALAESQAHLARMEQELLGDKD